jgi:CHAT domain-containing protein
VVAEIAARHALGWALLVLGESSAAMRTMRAGIRLAEKNGEWERAALVRRVLAGSLLLAGRPHAARRELETALASLSGVERARSQVHRLEIHRRSHGATPGVHRQVLADAARALGVLHRNGDEIWEARLLVNRGLLQMDRGELDRASADLERAHELYEALGAQAAAVDASVMVADLKLMRGEVVAALKALDGVDGADYNAENLYESRALALTAARLIPEARAAAAHYVEYCKRSGNTDLAASALLQLSAIELMSGETATAAKRARSAERSFTRRGKPVQAALARLARVRARLAEGNVSASAFGSAESAADVLERAGWRLDALRAHVLLARLALRRSAPATARRELERAAPLRTRGTTVDRIELLRASAEFELANGHTAGAERALERGLALLDEYRGALGAVELRAIASGIGAELAEAGLRGALGSRNPRQILAWAERLRASALRLPNVRPPADLRLQQLQVALRQAVSNGATAQQARLEAAIRSRARLVEPARIASAAIPDARETSRLLGDRVLAEYVGLDGALHAVTLANRHPSLHELPADATAELEWLRFSLGRLARGGTAAQRGAARESADAAAAALDEALIGPLLPTLRDAPLVVVPTGSLHAMPWAALPSLRGRPVVVAPSLAIWARLAALPRSQRRKTALVAGPRLRYAAAEVRELASLRRHAHVLYGRQASTTAVLEALDGAALAHLACHGNFRSDSPLFSSLELADGPLNVYELQTLRSAPEIVVLSACDVALSALHPGDELLGLAAALLGMGTRTVIASVVPVPDATARRMMFAFHRDLLAGHAPAVALARAQARVPAAGFVCLGTG